jgi:acylglycerol lipase
MAPKDDAIRGVIFLCHGYMDNSSFLKRIEYQRFVQKGFAVVMIEYEGHGRSDGPNTLIPCWNTMIGDVEQYFDEIAREKFPDKKKFLMGESMGGAIVYDVMSRNRSVYEGVLLVAPMCKVLNAPPDWVVKIFEAICGKSGSVNAFSIMPLAPTKGSIPNLSFKDKHKMALATSVPTSFGRKPRLATARELLVSELQL